jgi:hypothetical protein
MPAIKCGAPTRTMRPPSATRIKIIADYAAPERYGNKAWRANADYAATERDVNEVSKRARRANADYATTERDTKRAQREKLLVGDITC